jgi:hypothetical protein
VVRIIFHPSSSRLAISGPLKTVMPHATFWARHALGMVWKACSTSGALLLLADSLRAMLPLSEDELAAPAFSETIEALDRRFGPRLRISPLKQPARGSLTGAQWR